MNYFYLTNQIHSSSPEQRERIFEEIQNKPIGDKYYCRYYSCEREGDCDIQFQVSMGGGINDEVFEILRLPLAYPDVTEEEWIYYMTCPSLSSHRIFKTDSREEIWTFDDAIGMYEFYDDFDPSMLEMDTFRKVYDYDDNLISEEHKTVSYPVEKMTDAVRNDYEKWKEDSIKWEEDKKREEERQEAEYRLKHSADNDDDDLPF